MYPLAALTPLVLAFGLANAIPYIPLPSSLKIIDSLPRVPQGWTRLEQPPPSVPLRLRIALEEPDHTLFEQTLFQVSDPNHSKYGQHLKRDEVKALIKPKDESTYAVMSWLHSSGVADADVFNDGEWVNFVIPVFKAEEMMNTTFYYFTLDADKSRAKEIRALQYSVPFDVAPHITMIQPTTRFAQIVAERSTLFKIMPLDKKRPMRPMHPKKPAPISKIDSSCNYTITPACLRALYNIGDYRAAPNVGSLFGVTGFLKQIAKYDALHSFLKDYAPYATNQSFSFVNINGGKSAQNDTMDGDSEANLDMQYAASLGFKEDIVFYSTGGGGPIVPDLDQPNANTGQNEPYLDFLEFILSLDDHHLPQTVTFSYGEDEQSVPAAYAQKVCNMFGELGLRGASVLFSSGDAGVGSACQTNDGKKTTRFLPVFPAACPYVTSVGGTVNIPERAVPFSSGGFSDLFPRPSYQDDAVKGYLSILGSRWNGLYNSSGRGFPDISAQSYGFAVKDRDPSVREIVTDLVGGTRYLAPSPITKPQTNNYVKRVGTNGGSYHCASQQRSSSSRPKALGISQPMALFSRQSWPQ